MKFLTCILSASLLLLGAALVPAGAESPVDMPSPHGQVDGDAFGPNGPFGQTIASVQALTLSGKDTLYAGSFGNGGIDLPLDPDLPIGTAGTRMR